MIGTQLQALAYAVVGFPFALAAVAGVRAVAGLRSGRGTVVSTMYGCALLALVFLPLPDAGTPRLSQTVQPVPFQWVADLVTELHKHHLSIAHAPFTSAFLQVVLNVLLFVPLGALLRRRFRVSFRIGALAGFAASALIELTQLTGNFGTAAFAYRIADVDDLLANTTGAVLGVALMTVLTAVAAGRAVPAGKAVSRGAAVPAHSHDDRTVRTG